MRSLSTLNSVADEFTSYWQRVKNYVNELLQMPARVSNLDARIYTLQKKIARTTTMPKEQRKALIYELGRSAPKIGPMKETAIAVASRINNYITQWREFARTQSGLGVAPVLAAAAFAALAYVAVQGLALLKEYRSEKAIVDKVEAKTLSIAEAATLIREGKPKPIGAGIGEKFAEGITGALVPIGIAAVVGVVGYFYLTQRKAA